jgi:hypothetical protein
LFISTLFNNLNEPHSGLEIADELIVIQEINPLPGMHIQPPRKAGAQTHGKYVHLEFKPTRS